MPVQAHTNAIGTHQLRKVITEHIAFKNGTSLDREYTERPYAHSLKTPTVKSDGVKPTEYTREVFKTITSKPRKIVQDPGPGYDAGFYYEIQRPLELDYGPFSWKLWDVPWTEEQVSNESLVKALNNIAERKVEFGAAIGEARETLNTLADVVVPVAKSLLDAKRGRWEAIRRRFALSKSDVLSGKFAANKWLEYQYGWKPLFGTIHDLSEELLRSFELSKFDLTGRGTGFVDGEIRANGGYHIQNGYWSKKMTTSLTARIENLGNYQASRMGLINPAAIAWELVPFSFVIDWFIPIGNVLEAYTAMAGLSYQHGYRSRQCSSQLILQGYPGKPSWDRTVTDTGYYEEHGYLFARTPLYSVPIPGLYANLHPFNTTRVANAAALVRQLMK